VLRSAAVACNARWLVASVAVSLFSRASSRLLPQAHRFASCRVLDWQQPVGFRVAGTDELELPLYGLGPLNPSEPRVQPQLRHERLVSVVQIDRDVQRGERILVPGDFRVQRPPQLTVIRTLALGLQGRFGQRRQNRAQNAHQSVQLVDLTPSVRIGVRSPHCDPVEPLFVLLEHRLCEPLLSRIETVEHDQPRLFGYGRLALSRQRVSDPKHCPNSLCLLGAVWARQDPAPVRENGVHRSRNRRAQPTALFAPINQTGGCADPNAMRRTRQHVLSRSTDRGLDPSRCPFASSSRPC